MATELPTDAPADGSRSDDIIVSRRPERSAARHAIEWIAIVVGAIVLALVARAFFVQAFYIPSASMEPTLKIRDRVLVNKLSYRLHDVHRGDIIVFKAPEGEATATIKDLIKRVVALPGEKVEGHDGHVFVDEKQLKERYLPPGLQTPPFPPTVVPPESYWVMGDNRPDSKDSRFFKSIKKSGIVGRAFVRFWPVRSFGFL
jgi:signal peptidase I